MVPEPGLSTRLRPLTYEVARRAFALPVAATTRRAHCVEIACVIRDNGVRPA
jgi:hypothetical protein